MYISNVFCNSDIIVYHCCWRFTCSLFFGAAIDGPNISSAIFTSYNVTGQLLISTSKIIFYNLSVMENQFFYMPILLLMHVRIATPNTDSYFIQHNSPLPQHFILYHDNIVHIDS